MCVKGDQTGLNSFFFFLIHSRPQHNLDFFLLVLFNNFSVVVAIYFCLAPGCISFLLLDVLNPDNVNISVHNLYGMQPFAL